MIPSKEVISIRAFLYIVGATLLGGLAGYMIGRAVVTSDELDEVVELAYWTLGGGFVALVVSSATVIAARSKRGRNDL
jgi:membrane protein YqaA with SNARE-associated domain